jgi:cyclase
MTNAPPSREWPTGVIEIAKDVYAYVQAGGCAGVCNAGFIEGPDRLIVIDTLATTPMAMDFLAGIRRITGKPIGEVLLTHHHVDHILGIQHFLPARVICHNNARRALIAKGMDQAADWATRRPQHGPGLVGVRTCVPDESFEDRITFYLGEREIVFFHPGIIAHTRGDAMVYLPKERVLFAGDIFFHSVVPAAFQGHIGNWLTVLDRILAMDVETIVPGHGPIGGKRELQETRDCLALIYDGARRGFDKKLTPDEAYESMALGAYAEWGDAEERARQDIARAYAEFRGEIAQN